MPDYAFKSGQTKSCANSKGLFQPFKNSLVKAKPGKFGATVFENCSCEMPKEKKIENDDADGDGVEMENSLVEFGKIMNAGTSDGVKKAWETRKGQAGFSPKTKEAMEATATAITSKTQKPEAYTKAVALHREAAKENEGNPKVAKWHNDQADFYEKVGKNAAAEKREEDYYHGGAQDPHTLAVKAQAASDAHREAGNTEQADKWKERADAHMKLHELKKHFGDE